MSYKFNEPNTRKQIAKFSVDEWIEFRERLEQLVKENMLSERNERILRELIYNNRSTAELAYLGRTDESFDWLKSNQNKPLSLRRIQQILTDYFPEFHIQTTHKKNKANQSLRNEQNRIKKIMITDDSCCSRCGSKENLELHHMFPVLLGGDNDDLNLVILCHDCHLKTTIYNRNIIKQHQVICKN